MDDCFPPLPPLLPPPSGLHILLLVLLIGSIAGVILRSRRPASPVDLLVWGIVIAVTSLAYDARPRGEAQSGLLLACALVIWLTAGTGCVIVLARIAGPSVLVPLGILGFMALLFLPQQDPVLGHRPRTQCKDNLHNLVIALHNYHETYGRLPAAADDSTGPRRSWRVGVLPFLGGNALYKQYDSEHPWDDPVNLPVAQTQMQWPLYQCPEMTLIHDEQGRHYTSYAVPTGPGTPFPEGRGLRFEDFRDGTSNTVFLLEAAGLNIVWTEPRDFDVEQGPVGVNVCGDRPTHSPGMLSSYHRGGANVGMADGVVRYISEKVDPSVLEALTTADGGESIPDDF